MRSREHAASVQEAVASLSSIAMRYVHPRPWIAEILYYSIWWTRFDAKSDIGQAVLKLSDRLAIELGGCLPTVYTMESPSGNALYGLAVILEAATKLSHRMELFDEEIEKLMGDVVVVILEEVGT